MLVTLMLVMLISRSGLHMDLDQLEDEASNTIIYAGVDICHFVL